MEFNRLPGISSEESTAVHFALDRFPPLMRSLIILYTFLIKPHMKRHQILSLVRVQAAVVINGHFLIEFVCHWDNS